MLKNNEPHWLERSNEAHEAYKKADERYRKLLKEARPLRIEVVPTEPYRVYPNSFLRENNELVNFIGLISKRTGLSATITDQHAEQLGHIPHIVTPEQRISTRVEIGLGYHRPLVGKWKRYAKPGELQKRVDAVLNDPSLWEEINGKQCNVAEIKLGNIAYSYEHGKVRRTFEVSGVDRNPAMISKDSPAIESKPGRPNNRPQISAETHDIA